MNKRQKKRSDNTQPQVCEEKEYEVKTVREPKPVCAICGEIIENIADAIRENDGSFSHFDCVLNKIATEYGVKEPDKVSYIGSGSFAIVTVEPGTKNFIIKQKIPYESVDSFNQMKKFVEDTKE